MPAPVHLGLLPLAEDAPAQVQQWLINPEQPVSRRLYDASRVSTEMVRAASPWSLIQEDVKQALAGFETVFVYDTGHERAWFETLLRGEQGPRLADLHTLAGLFLPHRDLFDLKALCETTVPGYRPGEPQLPFLLQAFRRLLTDIAEVLLAPAPEAHLAYAWLERAVQAGVPDEFASLALFVEHAHLLLSDGLFKLPEPAVPVVFPPDQASLRAHLERLLPGVQFATKKEEKKKAPRPVKYENVARAFSALRSREGRHMRERSSQMDYARFCCESFTHGGLFAAEAGTGTGKTFGYLVPACEYVRVNPGRKVLVATATRTLQDQVAREELPRLIYTNSPHQDVRGAILKGMSNYLCAGALLEAHETLMVKGEAGAEGMLAWLYLYLRLRLCGGTIDDVPATLRRTLPHLGPLLEEVSADVACSQDTCSFSQCVYGRVLENALQSDIIVVNHFKLPSLPTELISQLAICIIDEADQLPDNLRNALSEELAVGRLYRKLLNRLVGSSKKRRGYLEVLEEVWEEDLSRGENEKVLTELLEEVKRIKDAVRATYPPLDQIGKLCSKHVRPQRVMRWVDVHGPQKDLFQKNLIDQLGALHEALDRVTSGLRRLIRSARYKDMQTGAGDSRKKRIELARLQKYERIASEWQEIVCRLSKAEDTDDWVYTVSRNKQHWCLTRTPFQLAEHVEEHLVRPYHAVVFTSATLFVENSLAYYRHVLDLRPQFDQEIRLPSPFDYPNRVFGAVTTFVPTYNYRASDSDKSRWKAAVLDTLRILSLAVNGRTLILFTSHAELREMHRGLSPLLAPFDIEVLCQQGASRSEIQRFRESEHTVLMGVDRFWAGVDFPGSTLSQVIIVRLPNPSLGDPLIKHRLEREGEAFWERYYRPATRMKLRQGFGRLIRRETDRGLFVVLDARLVKDTRMRSLQEELPIPLREVPCRDNPRAPYDLRRMLHEGLGRVQLRTEFEARDFDPFDAHGADVQQLLSVNPR